MHGVLWKEQYPPPQACGEGVGLPGQQTQLWCPVGWLCCRREGEGRIELLDPKSAEQRGKRQRLHALPAPGRMQAGTPVWLRCPLEPQTAR